MNMNAPFVFGKIATGDNFTDREQEIAHLADNFRSLINTVLISPRRWGKSSLVERTAAVVAEENADLRVCIVDLFNVKTEEQFYSAFAQAIIKATLSKWDEVIQNAKKFFSILVPKISISPDALNEITLDFDWEEMKKNPDEIIDLPEKIANEKGLRIIVCIDEFQNIAEFEDPLFFQRRLRAHWQRHHRTAYCLYGSKRHLMMDVFTNSSMPFYKFGDIVFLDKIDTPHFVAFIKARFESTGKKITDDACRLIVSLADNHPYYVQQLSQLSWLRTEKDCDTGIVEISHRALVGQFNLIFMNLLESLTFQQICYLRALVAGETAITSAESMHKYHISSATAASRSRASLIDRDILDYTGNLIVFQDPIFAYWLKHVYFEM